MSDSPKRHKELSAKDMYWFAHGGDLPQDKNHIQRNDDDDATSLDQSSMTSWKTLQDRKALPEEPRIATSLKESMVASLDGVDNSPALSFGEREDRVQSAPHLETTNVFQETKNASNHLQSSGGEGDDDRRRKIGGSRLRSSEKRILVEERKKQILEAEQEKNEAILKKNVEREATFEARRNAQRSNISFAFGSSLPRNLELEVTTVYQGSDLDKNKRRTGTASSFPQKIEETEKCIQPAIGTSFESSLVNHFGKSGLLEDSYLGGVTSTSISSKSDRTHFRKTANSPHNWLVGAGAVIADDKMSQSMISPSASRGRRKTDLTPTIPYDRTGPPRNSAPTSPTKRSVSMTRLDQLALPRRHYVEAHRDFSKANSTSSTSSSLQKDVQRSPSRPRSSMSAASEQSGGSNRVLSTPPAGIRPRTTARKARPVSIAGSLPEHRPAVETKSYIGHNRSPEKKSGAIGVIKRTNNKPRSPRPRSANLEKLSHVSATTKQLTPKSSPVKLPSKDKKLMAPDDTKYTEKQETLKATVICDETSILEEELAMNGAGEEKNSGKRIISEEEAKAALAEKRRLAREQAEKEAELERQRQEGLRLEEEERIRKEEEEQRRLEEEQLRLLEEHKKYEEEKLRKAIEEQEKKEEEEKVKREEETRIKAEQEKKAKEEAERQRIELEEKLRKEEEERAERKKRLEKIMSRTRGKSGTASPIGNLSGGDHSDGADSQADAAEALSGNSSLNSNQSEPSSGSVSLEMQQPPQESSETESESLNSMDMMALSENSSLDSNLLMLPSDHASLDSSQICDDLAESEIQNTKVFSVSNEGDVTEISTVKAAGLSPVGSFGLSNEDQSISSSENDTLSITPGALDAQNGDKSSCALLSTVDASDNSMQEQSDVPQDSSVFLHSNTNDLTNNISGIPHTEMGDHPSFKTENLMQSSFMNLNELKFAGISSTDSNPFTDSCKDYDDQGRSLHYAVEFNDNLEINFCKEDKHTPKAEVPNLMFESHEIKIQPCDIGLVESEGSTGDKKQVGEFANSSLNIFSNSNTVCEDTFLKNNESITASDIHEVLETEPKSVDADVCLPENSFKDDLNLHSDDTRSLTLPSKLEHTFPIDVQASDASGYTKNSYEESAPDVTKYEGTVTSIEDFEMNSVNLMPSSRINLISETCVSSSINDSEDSSLDSNLSQAMNIHMTTNISPQEVENFDDISGIIKNGHLISGHSEEGTFILDSKSMQQYHEGTYIPKSNGYSESINGMEVEEKHAVVEDNSLASHIVDNQLNSNSVSAIDNRVGNIFDNADDINFNKISSNPFMPNEDITKVSGNPFLNQDETEQNPITTDFFA